MIVIQKLMTVKSVKPSFIAFYKMNFNILFFLILFVVIDLSFDNYETWFNTFDPKCEFKRIDSELNGIIC